MPDSEDYPTVHSPLERRIRRDGGGVDVQIYRDLNETG